MPQIDFSHYYTYDEICNFLAETVREHPNLVSVSPIGKSYEGRDIMLATLTNRDSGPALEKPGYWIDANTHAGEVTGSAVALYTIGHYTANYGRDERVTRLLDDYAVYILPRITMDGSDHYLTSPHWMRSSMRRYPYVEDREGLYPEDVDGDGKILQMRIRDDDGAWRVSDKDPRIMLRRGPDDFGGVYYHLISEGVINSWDGHAIKLAPPRHGLDLNRNYPSEWVPEGEQSGAGDYPFSEPETRAEAEFWATHRNINGFLTYHTYAGVILRPYSLHPDDYFDTHDLEVYKLIGERGTELTGYPCVSAYYGFAAPATLRPEEADARRDGRLRLRLLWLVRIHNRALGPAKSRRHREPRLDRLNQAPPGRGRHQADEAERRQAGRPSLRSLAGVRPPAASRVEIGGWDAKNYWSNAPTEYLQELCENHCKFALAHALMSPRIAFKRREVREEAEGIYRISIVVHNRGFLPTYTSMRAQARKLVRPMQARIKLPTGAVLISGKLEGRSDTPRPLKGRGFWHLPGEEDTSYLPGVRRNYLPNDRILSWPGTYGEWVCPPYLGG